MSRLRNCFVFALALTLIQGSLPLVAQDKTDATAIVQRAIAALGGEDAIRKTEHSHMTLNGKLYLGSDKHRLFRMESWVDGTSRSRTEMRMTVDGKELVVVKAVSGNTGWLMAGDAVSDIGADELKEAQASNRVANATKLYPLLTDSRYAIERLADKMDGGQGVFVLKVSSKDHPDITLFINQKTLLLARVSFTSTTGKYKGKLIEEVYSDYRKKAGTKIAHLRTIHRDGAKYFETELLSLEILTQVEPSLFKKPNKDLP
ncbi:MAG TPA: hypothetical protein VFE62_16435 [Gemmataceae bacterium]|nr:hypothetical protein [Gemmataceae bacterium]